MPYDLEYTSRGIYVKNKETGKRMNKKPHPSREKAIAHMKALYANVPDAKK